MDESQRMVDEAGLVVLPEEADARAACPRCRELEAEVARLKGVTGPPATIDRLSRTVAWIHRSRQGDVVL